MSYRLEDFLFAAAMWLAGLLILGILLAVGVEATQERRSYDAQVACEQQRMIPRRQSLSAKVVCVPAPTRQDTTTVNLR